jgi:hypothetical protein
MKLLFLSILLIAFTLNGISQASGWNHSPSNHKFFNENIGQYINDKTAFFENEIKFSVESENEDYFFTPSGVVMKFQVVEKGIKTDSEKIERKLRKMQGFSNRDEFVKFELEGEKMTVNRDQIECKWLNSNPNVQIIGEEINNFYHNYSIRNKPNQKAKSFDNIRTYKRIVYKDLYPKIDVVYEIHPLSGIKYSIIVHPGGDISQVKLKYSKPVELNSNGSVHISTKFGDIIDHLPFTFYELDSEKEIKSSFLVNENIISFEVDNYDQSKTIVIDPWTQAPAFNTNWDCVWECEKDASGNVYIIGGVLPMQIIKYNSTGAMQWVYTTPYDTTSWLGSFVVDDVGNSYVSLGSIGRLQKINSSGSMVWDNPNPVGSSNLTEFWSLALSCDQSDLFIGGTSGISIPSPFIFEIDINNGNILDSIILHQSEMFNVQEVRSLVACEKEKFYFLTQDSIGFVTQGVSTCEPNGIPHHIDNEINFGYKCENFRINNTGINALAPYGQYIFVHKGNRLQKRDFNTSVILDSVNIPGGIFNVVSGDGVVGCSGIDIDDCGNIYVGSVNGVYQFDQNLNQIANYPIAFTVYDVEVNTNGEVLVVGSTGTSASSSRVGTIQSISTSACSPIVLDCCNPSICDPGNVCITDGAFSFNNWEAGGTWSASCGACINSSTGLFDPNFSGIGQFTIYYDLVCGSDSIDINVSECLPMSACVDINGDISLDGGTAPFDWYEYLPITTTPILNQTECLNCDAGNIWISNSCYDGAAFISNCTNPAGFYFFANGNLVTPGSNYPIKVIDFTGAEFLINDINDLSVCDTCPVILLDTSNVIHVDCFGSLSGSISILPSGGNDPYDYTISFNSTIINSYIDSLGIQTFPNLSAGLYTLVVSDSNSCSESIDVTLSTPMDLNISYNVLEEISGSDGSIDVTITGGTTPYLFDWSNDGQGDFNDSEDLIGLVSGTYSLSVMDDNGCLDTVEVFVGSQVSINENNFLFDINVFPNPNNGNFTIDFQNVSEDFEIELFDIAGKIIISNQLILASSKTKEINNLKAGTYLLNINSKLGVKTLRIVVI